MRFGSRSGRWRGSKRLGFGAKPSVEGAPQGSAVVHFQLVRNRFGVLGGRRTTATHSETMTHGGVGSDHKQNTRALPRGCGENCGTVLFPPAAKDVAAETSGRQREQRVGGGFGDGGNTDVGYVRKLRSQSHAAQLYAFHTDVVGVKSSNV